MNFVDPDIGETTADVIGEFFAAPENPAFEEYGKFDCRLRFNLNNRLKEIHILCLQF